MHHLLRAIHTTFVQRYLEINCAVDILKHMRILIMIVLMQTFGNIRFYDIKLPHPSTCIGIDSIRHRLKDY